MNTYAIKDKVVNYLLLLSCILLFMKLNIATRSIYRLSSLI